MDFLVDLLGSAALGGITGLFGNVLKLVHGHLEGRRRLKERELDHRQELELLKESRQAAHEENEQQIALSNTDGSWGGLQASVAAEAQVGETYRWVNAIRALNRPALIWALVAVSVWMIDLIARGNIVFLSDAQRVDILTYSIHSMIFITSTAVTFWFGDRALKPTFGKARGG